ncbi:MAG: protoporphyrinogen oxidase, partial [Firmicutes bacterium]|nr:protoporphyrinogen oxidase [Bacillota bacterium]
MATDPLRIAIVGGGIAGLAAAWEWVPLLQRGRVRVTVLESRDRFGGLIRTDRRSGLVIEGGPDSFLARKPEARELCRAVGLGEHLIGTRPDIRGAYIYHHGRLHPIPAGMQAGIPSDLGPLVRSGLLSPWGKFRASWDLWLPRVLPRDGRDVSVGWFLRRRFGEEVVVRLAEPMLSGIYAADIDQLSLAATFPRLAEIEHRSRSLILGLSRSGPPAPARDPASPPPSLFQTLDTGLDTLIDTLVAHLTAAGAELLRGHPVESISREGRGYRLGLA